MLTGLVNKWVAKNEAKGLDKREAVGVFASIVGAISNLLLFLIKLVVGLISGSIAITADSINNLSDTGASLVALIGFIVGRKPADEEHPFGHGRMEYISAFIVSMLILFLGFEFFTSSVKRIFNPTPLQLNPIMYIVLIGTTFAKIWQSLFYKHYGTEIESDALMAVSKDSYFDVIITSLTIVSAFIYEITGWYVDGIAGVFVAVMLLYAGYSIAKDTLSPLLGERPDKNLVHQVRNIVETHDEIVRSHDLVIHNYGPVAAMATIHVEMSENLPMNVAHEVIEAIMKEVESELSIHLLIHIDPVNTDCNDLNHVRDLAGSILKHYEGVSAHEFAWSTDKNEACFEMTFTLDYSEKNKNIILASLRNALLEAGYKSHIHVDQSIT